MFGSVVHMQQANVATVTLPRPRPTEADATTSEPHLAETRANEPRLSDVKANDKGNDPVGSFLKATAPPAANVPRPPAPIPAVPITGSRRVAAVQRVLSENGYGQLRATGTIGADTQAAIQRFERDRKLPVTGQVSDRLVRELTAMIGHPID
jgi:hypothetical protein